MKHDSSPHRLASLAGQVVEVHPSSGRSFRGTLVEVNADGSFVTIDQLGDGMPVYVALSHIIAVELVWPQPAAEGVR